VVISPIAISSRTGPTFAAMMPRGVLDMRDRLRGAWTRKLSF
jgi:hypothetical protein